MERSQSTEQCYSDNPILLYIIYYNPIFTLKSESNDCNTDQSSSGSSHQVAGSASSEDNGRRLGGSCWGRCGRGGARSGRCSCGVGSSCGCGARSGCGCGAWGGGSGAWSSGCGSTDGDGAGRCLLDGGLAVGASSRYRADTAVAIISTSTITICSTNMIVIEADILSIAVFTGSTGSVGSARDSSTTVVVVAIIPAGAVAVDGALESRFQGAKTAAATVIPT